MNNGKEFTGKITRAIVAVALAFLCLGGVYMLWERAPEIRSETPTENITGATEPGEETAKPETAKTEQGPEVQEPASSRQKGVYTILMVGNDDGNGNTDTIVVGRIDTKRHKMDFVSIPRDTLVNIDWSIRKINAVYWGDINSGGNGVDMLREQVENLIGFQVDCYAVIDLDVLESVVDTLGGVYFDVPMAMDYEDPTQNLSIHIQPGYQLLNGDQALGVCRYRSGYVDGDIGRIAMQQRFLKACMTQFISLGNIPNVAQVVQILADGLDTDMTAANIAFFMRQALQCDSEDIHFYTMPTTDSWVGGLSYTIVDLEKWIPMVNECLNPYKQEISVSNLDIVYRENGVIRGTVGLKGAWYYAGL